MNVKDKLFNDIHLKKSYINWVKGSKKQYQWVNHFKNVFILQKTNDIHTIFNKELFGLHNGFTLDNYCDYEFKEFELKSKNFGLNIDCHIECYNIGNEYLYLCLGKKTEKALFEAIFKWDDKLNIAHGNGYHFKIEPKTQFIIYQNKDDKIKDNITVRRRINFSPANPADKVKTVIVESHANNFQFIKNECEPHLGGTFYSLIFELDKEHFQTYWEDITIFNNIKGIKHSKSSIFMRGVDHPLFIDNLFPIIKGKKITCPEITDNLFILYVKLKNGKEFYYKYPKETSWEFQEDIEQASITDTLSFDWIVQII